MPPGGSAGEVIATTLVAQEVAGLPLRIVLAIAGGIVLS